MIKARRCKIISAQLCSVNSSVWDGGNKPGVLIWGTRVKKRENRQHRQISKVHVQCVVLHSHVYTTCSWTDWVPANLAEDLQLHSIPVPKCFGTFLNGLWSQIREHSPPGELLEWKGKKEQWVFLFPLSENKEDKKNNEQAWTFPGFLL